MQCELLSNRLALHDALASQLRRCKCCGYVVDSDNADTSVLLWLYVQGEPTMIPLCSCSSTEGNSRRSYQISSSVMQARCQAPVLRRIDLFCTACIVKFCYYTLLPAKVLSLRGDAPTVSHHSSKNNVPHSGQCTARTLCSSPPHTSPRYSPQSNMERSVTRCEKMLDNVDV